jgi:hypothetical protein
MYEPSKEQKQRRRNIHGGAVFVLSIGSLSLPDIFVYFSSLRV